MDAKEYKGKWWLPERPDNKVAGILYYKPSEEFRLELIGSFDTENDDSIAAIFSAKKEDVIHGQASDGTNISLFDSHCHIAHIGKADFSTVVYKARAIAIGMHLDGLDDKRFFKAAVKIPELSYWLYPAALQQMYRDTDNGHGIYIAMESQKEEEREVAKTEVKKGLKICLCRNASFQGGDFSFKPTFEQFTSLQIESTSDISMQDMYIAAVRFERFMSLATMREVGYTDLQVYSKEYFFTVGKEKVHYKPVSIDTTFHQRPCEKKIEKFKFLFDYEQVAEIYPKAIKKWFANDWKFDAIRGHFLDSIEYHGAFSYINFLIVIQAVEGYGNRYLKKSVDAYKKSLPEGTKTKKLHNILTTVFRMFTDVKVINQSTDLDAIVETRNYHSHLLSQRGKKWVDGLELYDLTDELRKVLICCIMSYLGFPNKMIDQLTTDTNNDLFRE